MIFGLLGLLFVVGVALVVVRRVVTLPRQIQRMGRNIQSISNSVQQRQADKAAGKPVAPINILGLAGVAVALLGVIVARTTNGIVGIGILIIALGMMLIGFNLLKAKPTSTSQDTDPHRQVRAVLTSTDDQTQNSPVDPQSPVESAAQYPASLPRPAGASASGYSPSPSVKPPPNVENVHAADPNRLSTTRSASPELRVGGTAKVISADKRFAGRIGQVVAIDGQDVELKISGTFGSLSFRRKDVAAVSEPTAGVPRTGTGNKGGLMEGAMAKVISGDPRYVGRVGRVVGVDRGMTTLKLSGTFGALDFMTSDIAAV